MLLGAATAKTGGRINSNLCKLWRCPSPAVARYGGGGEGVTWPPLTTTAISQSEMRPATTGSIAVVTSTTPRGPAKHFQVLRNVIKSKQKFFVGEEEKRNFALYRI